MSDVGRPEIGDTPGLGGGTVSPGGKLLPSVGVEPGAFDVLSTDRLGIDEFMLGVPGIAPARVVAVLPAFAPGVAFADGPEAELPVPAPAAAPLAPAPPAPAPPPLWANADPTHVVPQSPAMKSNRFVFMGVWVSKVSVPCSQRSPVPATGGALNCDRPKQKTFVPAGESASVAALPA
jgi:hypothetical protein